MVDYEQRYSGMHIAIVVFPKAEVHMTAENIIETKEEKLNIFTNCGESCFLAVLVFSVLKTKLVDNVVW